MTEKGADERLDSFRENVSQRFDGVDKRFDGVDQRFKAVDKRFDRVEGDIKSLRGEMSRGFERMDARFEALIQSMLTLSWRVAVGAVGLAGSIVVAAIIKS